MRRIAFSVCMSVAAGGALALSSPVAAEDCYRIIDLGPLGFLPIGHNDLFGINNNGQGVFTAEVNQKKHAMLYLPTAAFNLAAGCHDLHDLANFPPR